MPDSRTPRRERSPRICSLRLRAYAVCARLVAPDEALHEAGPHRCAGRYFRAVSSAQPCCVSRRCFIPSFLLLSSLSLPLCCLSLSLSRRVLEDRAGDRHRLCDHGLHRLLREAHLHPDQQHHRCARSSSSKSFTATLSTNCVCSLSRCRALQSAWAEVVLLSRCMEERMDRMRGGGSLAAGFYEETRGERRSPAAAFLVWMRCSEMAPTTR